MRKVWTLVLGIAAVASCTVSARAIDARFLEEGSVGADLLSVFKTEGLFEMGRSETAIPVKEQGNVAAQPDPERLSVFGSGASAGGALVPSRYDFQKTYDVAAMIPHAGAFDVSRSSLLGAKTGNPALGRPELMMRSVGR